MTIKWPMTLKNKARDEGYTYFDREIRALQKDESGKIDITAIGLEDNDVDAFRHAFVSGVFTQEYGEKTADIFGRLNEAFSIGNSQPGGQASMNMDLWNNAVGRKYGKKAKDRQSLLKMIHKALDDGKLIISPEDERRYNGATNEITSESLPVFVLKEDDTGRNEFFLDTEKGNVMSSGEFVSLINSGKYPGYIVKNINGIPTPVSKPDGIDTNNLG